MIAPTPNGNVLSVAVTCTARPGDEVGAAHIMTIHPEDWSCTSMHDLAAERVARALVSEFWSACLLFIESVVPAYRRTLQVMHDPTSLDRRNGMWLNQTTGGKCLRPAHQHGVLRDAVRHEISMDHASALFLSDERRVPDVKIAAADPELMAQGHESFVALWREGILPAQAEWVAASVPQAAFPLPADFYSNIYFNLVQDATRGGSR